MVHGKEGQMMNYYVLFREPNVTNWIRWFDHIIRSGEGAMVKKVLIRTSIDNRGRGRPKDEWQKQVEEDLKELGVKKWKEIATKRKEWKTIVKRALGH